MPPSHDPMGQHPRPPHHGSSTHAAKQEEADPKLDMALHAGLPEDKRRKFILVEDTCRTNRIRVRVKLDEAKMSEIPDSYRKSNSVYPGSYFAVQMTSPPASPRGSRQFNEDAPDPENHPGYPVSGSSQVIVPTLDGKVQLPMPRLTKTKRTKEIALNDMGYRMAWLQSRVFAGRTLFLQKSRKSSLSG